MIRTYLRELRHRWRYREDGFEIPLIWEMRAYHKMCNDDFEGARLIIERRRR